MMKRYEHTQIGYLIIILLSIGLLFTAYSLITQGFDWLLLSVLTVLGVCLIFFAKLTVIIKGDGLELRFGSGIIRKKIPLKNIESCQVIKYPWYYGWGIRLTPRGWLYNVSGFYAVEIIMKTGKKYLIGTDVPNELKKAIQESIEEIAK